MSDSSDDDVPLGLRAQEGSAGGKSTAANGPSSKAVPAKKPPATAKHASATNGVKKESGVKAVKKETANGTKSKAKSAVIVKNEKVKREKKEFDLPGQTRETPPETDPLRKFYTSLLEQRPDSQISKKWCVQHGLLSKQEALRYLEQAGKLGAAIKSPSKPQPAKRPADTRSPAPTKKQKVEPSKTKPKPVPKKESKPAAKPAAKDRAFIDSDSDDDAPLMARAKRT